MMQRRGGGGARRGAGGRDGDRGGKDGGKDGGKRRFFYRRAKVNPLLEKQDHIDWKDARLLQNFIPERGKILPRRISRASARSQRLLKTAIKRARFMALLPYS
ncbi:MAG TPA: 30S ribosomal protein S18 [Vicinamibacteria bacterium]|jgi:small subunit ribosomal protein S18